jgi:KUP system potassium uptake protein
MAKSNSKENKSKKYLAGLSLVALGVVFGDLGTSPLYSVQGSFNVSTHLDPTPDNVLGVLSLIFWLTLIFVVSFKYLTFILRADNNGEGGVIALMAQILPHGDKKKSKLRGWLVIAGLFAATMWLGDSLITPAITVVSSIGGLSVASLHLSQQLVIIITVIILLGLFYFQRYGSGKLGKIFGPIMAVWFATLGILGIYQIIGAPSVFRALNPYYAVDFFLRNGFPGYFVLGSVFLVVTGCEAVYADIGHFGVLPIRISWFAIVLPGLTLNYFGQGALLLQHPEAATNPFFMMVSGGVLYPVVFIATIASCIASQAVISGSFSVFRQAVHLGFMSRMKIEQTSTEEVGQVYLPAINWIMMILCIALVIGFGSSTRLAEFYGVGISVAFVTTSILFGVVTQIRWNWNLALTIPLICVFLIVDLAFLGANIVKIPNGGWFQVVVGIVLVTIMTTWKRGRKILGKRLKNNAISLEKFLDDIGLHAEVKETEIKRVEGTAIYMYSNPEGTPQALLYNIKHNKVIHENVVILVVNNTDERSFVPLSERIETENLGQGFYRIIIQNGFAQGVNIPYLLKHAEEKELQLNVDEVTYFLGKERILPTDKKSSEMAKWRDQLFGLMVRNEQPATKFFHLPADRVVEIGAQLTL